MNLDTIKFLLEKVRPLSTGGDLAMSADILNFYKPKNILELGAGNGDWLIFMSYILKDIDTKFYGYENFTWTWDDTWKTNLNDLNLRIDNLKSELDIKNDINIFSEDIKNFTFLNFKIKFDIVRLDCLAESSDQIVEFLETIYPHTTENCIFFIDDINPNYVPNRFLAMMELTRKKKVKPLWFGTQEGAWINYSQNTKDFIEYVQKVNENKLNEIHPMIQEYSGKQFQYITTRSRYG